VIARPEGLDRRLAAVWFADIVDYTRLSAEDEEAALSLVQDFQEAARELVAREGGRIVKFVGDAALAEFPSSSAAVAAALDLQPALAQRLEEGGQVRQAVRAGVHVGEVSGTPDGDVYGDGVNVASRIHAEADPGAVVVSEEIARHLRARRELVLEPLGARSLKGLVEPVRIFAVRRAEERAGISVGRGGGAILPMSENEAGRGSIAVLPFNNLSPDPENEYFSDGVTEEILTSLAKVEGLKVISRTSVMRYKGTTKSLREIGRELGVASILEGSVRRAGDRVRITAQLIDARGDQHLWADRYDRDLEDIFAIQTDVAESIVEALRMRLTARERAAIGAVTPVDRDAYEETLKGRWFANRRTHDDLIRAIGHFERAIQVDSGYARAHAGVALASALRLHWERPGFDEARDRAVASAGHALALDPSQADAHAARAMALIYDRDWDRALHDFQRAIEMAPGDAQARQWHAHLLACLGRFDEAFSEIGLALELDPLSLAVITEAGNVHFLARRYDEALASYHRALDLDPRFHPARYKLYEAYLPLGRLAEAIDQGEKLRLIDAELATRCRAAGPMEGGRLMLEHILENLSLDLWPYYFRAVTLAMLGRLDEAFGQLLCALDQGDWYLVRVAVSPQTDALRRDPRFAQILKRADLDRVPLPPPETWLPAPFSEAGRPG
jgi:adenylate cyclase